MGGDLIASGSFRAKQLFYNNCKYSDTGGAGSPRKMFVRWGANGADNSPGSNNRFVVPYSGRLYKGPFDCFKKILETEGPMGFYKGVTANYVRMGPQYILTFVFYEKLMSIYKSR